MVISFSMSGNPSSCRDDTSALTRRITIPAEPRWRNTLTRKRLTPEETWPYSIQSFHHTLSWALTQRTYEGIELRGERYDRRWVVFSLRCDTSAAGPPSDRDRRPDSTITLKAPLYPCGFSLIFSAPGRPPRQLRPYPTHRQTDSDLCSSTALLPYSQAP